MQYSRIKNGSFSTLLLCSAALAQNSSPHVRAPQDLGTYLNTGPAVESATPHFQNVQTGLVQAAVKLQRPPLVVAIGANAKQNGSPMSSDQQRAYLAQLQQEQNAVMSQVAAFGGVELGRVSKSHNAVMVSIDAGQLQALKSINGVANVRLLTDSQLSLANTVPYIGAQAVQATGITGQGIRVAMLDSGIDYTHYNLGGSGNVPDFLIAKAAASGKPPASLFPTQKVIGGYDFVGDTWPNTSLTPDPNPLDLNGHGTRTADIVGGRSRDGVHVGVAPGTQLYAVKVCSSVSSSCSSVAILQGLDFALDPDSTGTLNHPVDIISMSVGASFGQREEDEAEAFTDIVNFGVVSVLSAGNDGDIPYVQSGPGSTPEVITVAATQGVTALAIPLVINSPASIKGRYGNTATVPWAPVGTGVTGDVVYVGQGCPAAGTTPADPYPAGNLAGKIFLVDRGTCSVSLKVDRAAQAGAIGVLIGLVAPGDAVSFANGGGTHFVPTLVIIQSYSTLIKRTLATSPVNVTFGPNDPIALKGSVAGYSSRGPNYSYNMLKPDIIAPGTVTAAVTGTGNGESSADGTSFACPEVAGSAALLLSKNRSLSPLEVKASLMETAETNVFNNSATQPGFLAPVTRAGSGELRVDRAAAGSTIIWDASSPLAVSLSFGTYRLTSSQTFKKKVIVRNYSSAARVYQITNDFRDAPNATGVSLSFPSSISVPANNSASFTLSLTVNGAALPTWTLDGGPDGGNGELLNTVEYAGYLNFTSGAEAAHIPWHILPHKAANVTTSTSLALNGKPAKLPLQNNGGLVSGLVDVFSLTGTGTRYPDSVIPGPGDDFTVTNLRAVGLRLICADANCATFGVQFAINTFAQRSHPDVPAEFDIYIDANNDGKADLIVFNGDIGFITNNVNTGQNGVFVVDIAAGTTSGPFSYTIADLNSANVIFTTPLTALKTKAGLQVTVSKPVNFSIYAYDNYFTGFLTDQILNMKYELDMPKYYADPDEVSVPVNGLQSLSIYPNDAANAYLTGPYNGNSPSQLGLLLMYTDGLPGREADIVTVIP